MRIKIEAENYNLDLTLGPSFLSSLYERVNKGHWTKVAGYLGGNISFRQTSPNLVEARSTAKISKVELESEALSELGLWHGPFEDLTCKLPRNVRRKIEKLGEVYGGVRLPVARKDVAFITIAVTLSKRTDYQTFVLKWCRGIWRKYGDQINKLARANLGEMREIGTSYQIINLRKTLRSFIDLPRRVGDLPAHLREFVDDGKTTEKLLGKIDPRIARLVLMNLCWGLGPKTIDSIILSTYKAPDFMPCDTHLRIVANRMGLVKGESRMPDKARCSKCVCDEATKVEYSFPLCPMAKEKSCLRSSLAYFGEMGGWFQTIAYLHGKSFCRKRYPKCNFCPINDVCDGYVNAK
jgi:endonuclease III